MPFRVYPLDDGPLWAISAGYFSPQLNAIAHALPGLHYDSRQRAHVGYIDAVALAAQMLADKNLRVDSSGIPDWSDYRHHLLVAHESSRDYQKTGIDFLIACGNAGALLADDMGTGKGHQSLRAARALHGKTLVICPRHVRDVWDRGPDKTRGDPGGEVHKWWPEAFEHIERLDGTKQLRDLNPDSLIAVTHYDIAHAWVDKVIAWGVQTLILDEAHLLMSISSRRSKAAAQIRAVAKNCFALTGTPPTDKIRDLWGMVEVMSPGRFGGPRGFFSFGKRYCDGKQVDVTKRGGITEAVWNFDGTSNLPELRDRLRWFCLRRTKAEVMKELPPITRQIIPVSVPPSAALLVKPESLVKDKGGQLRKALDLAADAKLPRAVEVIRAHLEAGHKVVAYTYRRAVCELIAEELSAGSGKGGAARSSPWEVRLIHGGVAHGKRLKRIDDLRRASGPGLLVANIDCASTGIDLTFANVETFVELVWEPKELLQAESRAHRWGQQDAVLVEYIIAKGTVDDLIVRGVIRKLGHQQAIIGKQDNRLAEDIKGTEASDNKSVLKRLSAELEKMYREAEKAGVGGVGGVGDSEDDDG